MRQSASLRSKGVWKILLFTTLLIPGSGFTRAYAEQVLWARGAVHFGHECPKGSSDCVLAHVPSPDHKKVLIARRVGQAIRFEMVMRPRHIPFRLEPYTEADLEGPYIEMEALWSPDSSAVSLAWNESAITERSAIFVLGRHGARKIDLGCLQESFARRFPPCLGDPAPCAANRNGEDYNYLTVAWAAAHTVVLMAEVPPSSSWGENMGEVWGYEVNVSTGRVVREMPPASFKRRWQSHLGWDLRLSGAR